MNMIVCQIFFCFLSLLTALIAKNNILAGIFFYLSKKASQTKLEKHSIPNLDLSEKIGKAVIK